MQHDHKCFCNAGRNAYNNTGVTEGTVLKYVKQFSSSYINALQTIKRKKYIKYIVFAHFPCGFYIPHSLSEKNYKEQEPVLNIGKMFEPSKRFARIFAFS